MKNEENKTIVLEGMSWLRVFSACQALMAPTKFYRVTHKRAREVLRDELGFCPKGKPGEASDSGGLGNKGFREGGKEAMLDWLGVVFIETHKEEGCVLPSDRTLLIVKAA
jgi:hypothetical protein